MLIKRLNGTHIFDTYVSLCVALNIIPAKRGKDRDAQKKEIGKYYELEQKKRGGRDEYIITYITKRKAAVQEKQKNLEARLEEGDEGVIELPSEKLIDVNSRTAYEETGIYELAYYYTFDSSIHSITGLVCACCGLKNWLNREDYNALLAYAGFPDHVGYDMRKKIVTNAVDFVRQELSSKISSCVKRMVNDPKRDLSYTSCYTLENSSESEGLSSVIKRHSSVEETAALDELYLEWMKNGASQYLNSAGSLIYSPRFKEAQSKILDDLNKNEKAEGGSWEVTGKYTKFQHENRASRPRLDEEDIKEIRAVFFEVLQRRMSSQMSKKLSHRGFGVMKGTTLTKEQYEWVALIVSVVISKIERNSWQDEETEMF